MKKKILMVIVFLSATLLVASAAFMVYEEFFHIEYFNEFDETTVTSMAKEIILPEDPVIQSLYERGLFEKKVAYTIPSVLKIEPEILSDVLFSSQYYPQERTCDMEDFGFPNAKLLRYEATSLGINEFMASSGVYMGYTFFALKYKGTTSDNIVVLYIDNENKINYIVKHIDDTQYILSIDYPVSCNGNYIFEDYYKSSYETISSEYQILNGGQRTLYFVTSNFEIFGSEVYYGTSSSDDFLKIKYDREGYLSQIVYYGKTYEF